MNILGIDPGQKTGWCVYDSQQKDIVDSGTFEGDELPRTVSDQAMCCDAAVIERPVGQGPTRPQVVDAAYKAGRLYEQVLTHGCEVRELTRLQVKQALTEATHGEIRVVNDATAKAALVLLHGEGSDKKPRKRKGEIVAEGGALGMLRGSDEWAACAVAVAWSRMHKERHSC